MRAILINRSVSMHTPINIAMGMRIPGWRLLSVNSSLDWLAKCLVLNYKA